MKANPFLLVAIILSPKRAPKINTAVEKVLSGQTVEPRIGKAPNLSLKKN